MAVDSIVDDYIIKGMPQSCDLNRTLLGGTGYFINCSLYFNCNSFANHYMLHAPSQFQEGQVGGQQSNGIAKIQGCLPELDRLVGFDGMRNRSDVIERPSGGCFPLAPGQGR